MNSLDNPELVGMLTAAAVAFVALVWVTVRDLRASKLARDEERSNV